MVVCVPYRRAKRARNRLPNFNAGFIISLLCLIPYFYDKDDNNADARTLCQHLAPPFFSLLFEIGFKQMNALNKAIQAAMDGNFNDSCDADARRFNQKKTSAKRIRTKT